jgi:hypothetical protein
MLVEITGVSDVEILIAELFALRDFMDSIDG